MNKLKVLLLLSLIFFSCDKHDIVNAPLDGESILGKWDWVKSETQWLNYTLSTPGSTGYTHQLLFVNDKQIKIFYADTLSNLCDYIISDNSISICDESFTYNKKGDTLILSQAYVDGPTIYYKRLINF